MRMVRKYGLAILAASALLLPWNVSAKGGEVPPLFQEIKAASPLDLSQDNYETMTMKVEGRDVTFRAYTNLLYVAKPVDKEYQTMNIYVPEGYFQGGNDSWLYGGNGAHFPDDESSELYRRKTCGYSEILAHPPRRKRYGYHHCRPCRAGIETSECGV